MSTMDTRFHKNRGGQRVKSTERVDLVLLLLEEIASGEFNFFVVKVACNELVEFGVVKVAFEHDRLSVFGSEIADHQFDVNGLGEVTSVKFIEIACADSLLLGSFGGFSFVSFLSFLSVLSFLSMLSLLSMLSFFAVFTFLAFAFALAVLSLVLLATSSGRTRSIGSGWCSWCRRSLNSSASGGGWSSGLLTGREMLVGVRVLSVFVSVLALSFGVDMGMDVSVSRCYTRVGSGGSGSGGSGGGSGALSCGFVTSGDGVDGKLVVVLAVGLVAVSVLVDGFVLVMDWSGGGLFFTFSTSFVLVFVVTSVTSVTFVLTTLVMVTVLHLRTSLVLFAVSLMVSSVTSMSVTFALTVVLMVSDFS